MAEFDPKKNEELFKKGINVHKERGERYLNVVVYSYDGGTPKIRIQPSNKNTNPDCDPKKQWVNQHSITGITKEEANELIKVLEQAVYKLR